MVLALVSLAGCYVDQGSNRHASARAVGVNASGTAAVQAQDRGRLAVGYVVTPDGTWTPIGTLGPAAEVVPAAINDAGTVVGSLHSDAGRTAFVWDADQGMRPLASVVGVARPDAVDIADGGAIVGNEGGRGWLWAPTTGEATDLPPLPGAGRSTVAAVNDHGVAVGESDGRAVVWAPPGYAPVDLGAGAAYDVNDEGVIVGTSTSPGLRPRPVRWSATGHEATLLGDAVGAANAIDDDGTIVGQVEDRPVVWDADTLAGRKPGTPAEDETGDATDIDGAHIVGDAYVGPERHLVRYFRP